MCQAPTKFTERALSRIRQHIGCNGPFTGSSVVGLHLSRVFSYAEFSVKLHILPELHHPADPGDGQHLDGCMFKESGFGGCAPRRYLRAFCLPTSSNVERSLCAEFQVLDALACHFAGKVNDVPKLKGSEGTVVPVGIVYLFISTSPCLSCIGAIRHFQLLFPEVAVEMSELGRSCDFL